MQFITCASYHGSGSSALTDLITEFDKVKSFGDWEFSFVHDIDGIGDLEYHLVWNFNRLNTARAINRFLKRVEYENGNIFSERYRKFFGDAWIRKSKEYINQLCDIQYEGKQFDILYSRNWLLYLEKILNKLLHWTFWKKDIEREFIIKKSKIYCGHPSEEDFLYYTRRYINDLFSTVSSDSDFVIVDQIVASTNIEKYLRYFDDIKVVVVDRDPRDVFLLAKYHWQDMVVPTDVETYCKWFLCTRENGKYRQAGINDKQIKFLWFEDLIYKYDETVKELIEWIGIDSGKHIRKKELFNPKLSINNSRIWEKEKCSAEEIRYIEEHLKDYLYPIADLK